MKRGSIVCRFYGDLQVYLHKIGIIPEPPASLNLELETPEAGLCVSAAQLLHFLDECLCRFSSLSSLFSPELLSPLFLNPQPTLRFRVSAFGFQV